METILSKRLQMVADYIPHKRKLLDIGSDHAYLPIALVERGDIESAIAGEVVQGPFLSAQKNIKASGLDKQIEARLASGLEAMTLDDHIKTITICGMGGRLIAKILESGKEKLVGVETLVLQPNNREDDLRRWLAANQFTITAESILEENGKYYEIIKALPGSAPLTDLDCRFGPLLSKEKSSIFRAKWQRELDKLASALSCIPEDKQLDRSAISQKMKNIKEMLIYES
ncbi:tRNA (adenine(22)-N(1))-methyltransferase [Streptococcus pseudoporcinus]|uniref:tRNA-m1A22 methylase n=1 Tax=Streptococcus pseudoporcinus TaxID=361101 RepID=A0A4U9XSY1_9STRE|nr:tRNA (adenine(22)-N(1))-methyltransferase TrmK [Streptococcus pseudoporcinus]VTS16379.1 tRNA-m1A22 methylase [Streptococcus pseudoporcinus]VUC67913.1 tRNA-m1A22 methylase [Streptococcus pseudoporcinus]VUC98839.1 tRNA-m1A22 methylase [Streptococcus pseudoporcinus]VUC99231.1 tRNA-m1A22 methylase [Streptococcus pseudoporcinus]